MKKHTWALGILGMILCIGFGLLFPHLVFSRSIRNSLKKLEKYEIEPVEMGHTNSVINSMRACSDSDYIFDYQEEMAELSREQLIEICNSFLGELKLAEWGYNEIIVDDSNMKASCQLMVLNRDEEYRIKMENAKSYPVSYYESSNDVPSHGFQQDNFAISTTIWTVEVEYEPNNRMILLVDDKNQKVVQMYSGKQYEDTTDAGSMDMAVSFSKDGKDNYHVKYLKEVIVPYFQKYYDCDADIVDNGYGEFIVRLIDKNDDAIVLSFDNIVGKPYMTTLK